MAGQKQQPQTVTLTISAVGGMGDGIARLDGKTVFVPLTCPEDVVEVEVLDNRKDYIHARLLRIVQPSPLRQVPPCQHFGQCGGCSLQHLGKPAYGEFKQGILTQVISELGASPSVLLPMASVGPHSRRRVEFKIQLNKGDVSIGFFAPKSHRLIALAECPVSEEKITQILPDLQQLLQSMKKPGQCKAISLTALDAGLDAVILTRGAMHAADKQALVTFAQQQNIVRLYEQADTPNAPPPHCLYDLGRAVIHFGGVEVVPPSGAFLQASRQGQAAIGAFVTRYLQGCQQIADLYAGCGTYSFPLSEQGAQLSAYEGGAEMVIAMHNAATSQGLDGTVRATTRDLFAQPLTAGELQRFDGIVINPPRNGALPQVKQIGQSGVGRVVMVSCNPATFKRDARQLLQDGYRLQAAQAIDQFYWSGHLEIAAAFSR